MYLLVFIQKALAMDAKGLVVQGQAGSVKLGETYCTVFQVKLLAGSSTLQFRLTRLFNAGRADIVQDLAWQQC